MIKFKKCKEILHFLCVIWCRSRNILVNLSYVLCIIYLFIFFFTYNYNGGAEEKLIDEDEIKLKGKIIYEKRQKLRKNSIKFRILDTLSIINILRIYVFLVVVYFVLPFIYKVLCGFLLLYIYIFFKVLIHVILFILDIIMSLF
jgi:hypothetical protein